MKEKDRYLLPEILFTFLLIESVILLFGEIIHPYGAYLSLGLMGGFAISWFIRNMHVPLTRISVNIAILGVFAWIVYSLVNSSFLYREIIAIFIRGLFIIEIILSLNIRYASFLTYIQVLSVPLFMCFPIFVSDYNEGHIVLVLSYIIFWIIILKIKFYAFVKVHEEKRIGRYAHLFVFALILLIILSLAWFLFKRTALSGIEKGGVLFEEHIGSQAQGDLLEKEYYSLQDQIQKEISDMIPGLDFQEDRQETLTLLSLLIKESPTIAEVRKARLGLISRLREPGPGLEKAKGEEITDAIQKYVEKKIRFNMKRTTDNIANNLKKNRFNLADIFSVSEKMNKMQNAKSREEIRKYAGEMKDIINASSAGDQPKRELCKLIEKLKDWKTFDTYRNKADALDKRADTMDERPGEELRDLLSQIGNAERSSELKEAEKNAEKFKGGLSLKDKDASDKASELLGLKSDMALSDKAGLLKDEIKDLKIPDDSRQELEERVEGIRDADGHRKFSEELSGYQDKIDENRVDIPAETEELLDIKAHLLFNAKKEDIRGELQKSNLPDKGERFMGDLEKLEEAEEIDKLVSDTDKLKGQIREMSEQGLISKLSTDKLIRDMSEIAEILLSKLKAGEISKEGRKGRDRRMSADYRDELIRSIEESSLDTDKKETLKQLAQALDNAQNISQLESVREMTDKELKELPSEKTKRDDIEKIRGSFESSFKTKSIFMTEENLAALREKTNELREINPQAAEKIEAELMKIRDSRTAEELKKRVDGFKELMDSREQELKEQVKEQKKEEGDPQIYILPVNPVMPPGSSLTLAAVAVYNKTFIKALVPEAKWFSSQPHIAWVDNSGTIHTMAKGSTQIYARYGGKESQKVQVTVVDSIDEQISKAVERALVR